MFTPRQQGRYRPLVQRAWLAHCARTGQNPIVDSAHETWYREQLLDACGIYTTRQANQVEDYDQVSLHFAIIVGDVAAIDYFTRASERRLRFFLQREINRGAITESYVLGIARNMGFLPASTLHHEPSTILQDLPADHLWRIWNALIRHNARHAGRVRPPAGPERCKASHVRGGVLLDSTLAASRFPTPDSRTPIPETQP